MNDRSTPIAPGMLMALMFVALPGIALGLNYGGLGPWALAAAGLALAFVIQTHRLPGMTEHLSKYRPESRRPESPTEWE